MSCAQSRSASSTRCSWRRRCSGSGGRSAAASRRAWRSARSRFPAWRWRPPSSAGSPSSGAGTARTATSSRTGGHAVFSNLALVQLLRATALALLLAGGIALRDAVGASLWPAHWPLGLEVALGLVVGELGFYPFHRWMHEGFGWRFHSVHHSSTRLYWLNSLRTHPLNTMGSFLSIQAPLALLGASPDTMALVGTFHAAHGILQHANVDLRLGPLNWLVSGPELHRWHHSRSLAEANHNYGNNLAVWDVVFGTYFLPSDRPGNRAVGIEGLPGFPQSWGAQLVLPFRWRWSGDPPARVEASRADERVSPV